VFEAFVEKGIKKKKYAKELGIDVEQLKGFLGEAIKNEDEAIKKLFEESGLEEEEFAAEFKVSPERLKSILNPK
jgi:plasmid maintenance system antidote protein VapI